MSAVAHFFVVVSGSKIHERVAHFFIDIYILLFLFLELAYADRDIGIATFFFKTPSEIIMSTIYGAGTAGAFHKIMTMLGFYFIATDVATDSVSDNHGKSSFMRSVYRCTPIRTPSMNPDF